jgi:hypothetical protein
MIHFFHFAKRNLRWRHGQSHQQAKEGPRVVPVQDICYGAGILGRKIDRPQYRSTKSFML